MPGKYINSPFPADELKMVDPFVLLHHFGPFEVNKSGSFSFEPHPHRGFEAVTFLFEGEFEHRDSTGAHGKLYSGDVQWMTAGSGVLHEEKQPDEFLEKGGTVHGIQLWINLPKKFKMTKPKYQDIRKDSIPVIEDRETKLRVIAGNYKNVTGPAETFSPMTVIHGISDGGIHNIEIPEKFACIIYITRGNAEINGITVDNAKLSLMSSKGTEIEIKTNSGTEYLLLSGEPINEPVVQYGPFVMNNMGEIKQAYLDYRNGIMGSL